MRKITQHTQEPWKAVANVAYWEVVPINNAGENGVPFTIADVCASSPNNRDGGLQEANARRIVACVNACAGIDTDVLEQIGTLVKSNVDALNIINKLKENQ